MSTLRNTLPASLRLPALPSSGMARPHKQTIVTGTELKANTLVKTRLANLPQEPEDARMTGVTRSLNRRLLALNVPGSLRMGDCEMAHAGKSAR